MGISFSKDKAGTAEPYQIQVLPGEKVPCATFVNRSPHSGIIGFEMLFPVIRSIPCDTADAVLLEFKPVIEKTNKSRQKIVRFHLTNPQAVCKVFDDYLRERILPLPTKHVQLEAAVDLAAFAAQVYHSLPRLRQLLVKDYIVHQRSLPNNRDDDHLAAEVNNKDFRPLAIYGSRYDDAGYANAVDMLKYMEDAAEEYEFHMEECHGNKDDNKLGMVTMGSTAVAGFDLDLDIMTEQFVTESTTEFIDVMARMLRGMLFWLDQFHEPCIQLTTLPIHINPKVWSSRGATEHVVVLNGGLLSDKQLSTVVTTINSVRQERYAARCKRKERQEEELPTLHVKRRRAESQ